MCSFFYSSELPAFIAGKHGKLKLASALHSALAVYVSELKNLNLLPTSLAKIIPDKYNFHQSKLSGILLEPCATTTPQNSFHTAFKVVFILLGPVLLAASIYMALGRLIRSTGGEAYSLIRVKLLTKAFVSSDVISFVVQGTGSGMMSMGGSMASTAKRITIAALVIQLVMFGLFIVTSVIF